jgi:adenosylhomocysteine nucleosidase
VTDAGATAQLNLPFFQRIGIIYISRFNMDREKGPLCIVFPMGIEAHPFLKRVEVTRRWTRNRAVYREAFFEGHSLLIVRSGIGPARAAAAVKGLEARPSAILSVGTAGGLASDSRIRDIVVASEIVFKDQPDNVLKCSEELVQAVASACGSEGLRFRIARILTSSNAIISGMERRRLHEMTDSHAVDMESHAIGVGAAKMGVPFTAFRVISDDVTSAPFPEPITLKDLWRRPSQFTSILPAAFAWMKFIKDFQKSIELLPPCLVRFIRNSGKTS